MRHSNKACIAAIAALSATLSACASAPQPFEYAQLASASYMVRNTHDDAKYVPYQYRTFVDWFDYDYLIVDPVSVYQGSDPSLAALSETDKARLAEVMSREFSDTLHERFIVVTTPGPGTLRLKLTLLGATKTKPIVGTFTRLDIAGNIYNGVESVVGGRGAFTGEAIYAVEIFDAQTNRLLDAYVTERYPRPYNIPATFGALTAAEVGIKKGADALLARLTAPVVLP